jgi:hypothetical protein
VELRVLVLFILQMVMLELIAQTQLEDLVVLVKSEIVVIRDQVMEETVDNKAFLLKMETTDLLDQVLKVVVQEVQLVVMVQRLEKKVVHLLH